MADTIDPLVAADVDLRGMPFMPLEVQRLRDSTFALQATAEEFRAGILLWCASWLQVPAGSLPDDDASLASYAGFGRDLRGWRRVKNGALRGFVRCTDGRMYHPVIAEKAAKAWAERLDYLEIKENDRLRKAEERKDRTRIFAKLREYGVVMPGSTQTAKLREHLADVERERGESHGQKKQGHKKVTRTRHSGVTANKKKDKREGEGRERDSLKASSSSNNTSADSYQAAAAELARVLRKMGWSECADGHPELLRAAQAGIKPEALQAAAAKKAGKPISYVVSRAIGMRDDAASSSQDAGAEVADPAVAAAEQEAYQLRRQLDDKIETAVNDCRIGLIDEQTRDERVAAYRQALQELSGAVGGVC